MSETVIAEENPQEIENQEIPTLGQVTNVVAYIRGLVVGSLPQEFFELLVSILGVQNVNRMIALGGVKYLISVMNVSNDRAAKENKSVAEVISDERDKIIEIINRIFGEE